MLRDATGTEKSTQGHSPNLKLIMRLLVLYAFLLSISTADDLVEPTVISSTDSVWSATITVEEYDFSNSEVSFTTRAYCYLGTCSYPGPTIQVKPGDEFTLTVTNNLGAESTASGDFVLNAMHSPNTTNVHTHGLHIAPDVDSIFVEIAPGESHVYKYVILDSHLPGTHWYHSHLHGSSALQIMGGLAGALIVAPDDSFNLPNAITSWTSHVLVFTYIQFEQSVGTLSGSSEELVSQGCANGATCVADWQGPLCTGSETESPFAPFRIYSYLELSAETNSDLDANPSFSDSTESWYFTNGQFVPTISMAEDEFRILQLVHAVGGDKMDLEFRGPSTGCSMTVIAWDGVYLQTPYTASIVSLMAASRVDVVVTCTTSGTYTLGNRINNLLEIIVSGSDDSKSVAITESELQSINFPNYLDDLQSDTLPIDDTYQIHMSQGGRDASECSFWLGGGSDCYSVYTGDTDASATDPGCPFETFDGEQGSNVAGYKHVTTVGAINEWKIYGLGKSVHPLHLHVNHMQIVDFTYTDTAEVDGWEDAMAIGQWRDTVPTFDGELTVRFRASDFSGEHILHCHFLRHEDIGMMDSIYVVDAPSSSPTSSPTSAPSDVPTVFTTDMPTQLATEIPSISPSSYPTGFPTVLPTTAPTEAPTKSATSSPTEPDSSSDQCIFHVESLKSGSGASITWSLSNNDDDTLPAIVGGIPGAQNITYG